MSLEDIPSYFSDVIGTTEAVAQVILCVIVIFTMLLPTMYLMRDNNNSTPIALIMIFLATCLCIGLSWAPLWILIGEALMMAMAVAFLGSKITGD